MSDSIVLVPIFTRHPDSVVVQILEQTSTEVVCISSKTLGRVRELKAKGMIPSVKVVVSFDGIGTEERKEIEE